MDIWQLLVNLIFQLYRWFFIRCVLVSGCENLENGPKIVVANHSNLTDSCVLPIIFQENLTFLVQSESFSLPIIGSLLKKSGQIPVIKGQGSKALDEALVRLTKGETVVIYPEGKLNHGKGILRAGSGAAILAKRSGVPILPIGFYVSPLNILRIKGKIHDRQAVGCWQVRGNCYVAIGKPFIISDKYKQNFNHLKSRQITRQITENISDLVRKAQDASQNELNLLEHAYE